MTTIDIKKELHTFIDTSNEDFLKDFYALIQDYSRNSDHTKMIDDSEIEISTENIYSQTEVQKIIEGWKE